MYIVDFLLLRRILHDKHCIFLGERLPVQLHCALVRHKRNSLLCHEPAKHLAVLKILLAVLIRLLPCILIDHILTAQHRKLMHLYRTVDVYIFFSASFLHVSHKEGADRAAPGSLTFLTQLHEKGIYIILHIDLRTVTYISYLTNIFWYLSFHLYSPLI